jgi:hypothetical protein
MGKYFELKKGDLKFGKDNVIGELFSLPPSPAISWSSTSLLAVSQLSGLGDKVDPRKTLRKHNRKQIPTPRKTIQ